MNLHLTTVATAQEVTEYSEGEAAAKLVALIKAQRARRLDDCEYKQLLELEALLLSLGPMPSDVTGPRSRNVFL